jgi:hypothetical protein
MISFISLMMIEIDDDDKKAARREMITLTWTSSTTMALKELRDGN